MAFTTAAIAFVWKSRWAVAQMLLIERCRLEMSPENYRQAHDYYEREYRRAERARRLCCHLSSRTRLPGGD